MSPPVVVADRAIFNRARVVRPARLTGRERAADLEAELGRDQQVGPAVAFCESVVDEPPVEVAGAERADVPAELEQRPGGDAVFERFCGLLRGELDLVAGESRLGAWRRRGRWRAPASSSGGSCRRFCDVSEP
jgi:hypothetical protein